MIYTLSVANLSKRYDSFTLEDISFQLPEGSIVGLIGENGAGKSTLLHCILQLVKADSGTMDPPSLDLDRLSFIPDACPYPGILTPAQIESDLKDIYTNWDHDTFAAMCARFRIPMRKKLKTFSKGMKVKFCFCAAFSHHARLLILDEATSGLDPVVRDEILDLLLDFIQEEDHTVLFSTHITNDLEKIADYIMYIHDGKKMFMESKDELLESYVLMHVTKDQFKTIDPKQIIRWIEMPYQIDVLIKKEEAHYPYDPLRLEDVMRLYSKGGSK